MTDDHEAVMAELGRILASDAFVASPMLSAFLRFVVVETLAGRDDRLKAYTIAVGALERGDDFDPNDNPLVRVQARRLRQALECWYLTEGRGSDLVIELPLGTYVPNFVVRGAAEAVRPGVPVGAEDATRPTDRPAPPPLAEATPAIRRATTSTRRFGLLGLALALLVVAGIGGWYARSRLAPAADAPGAPAPTVGDRRSQPETEFGATGLDAARVLPLLAVSVEIREPRPADFDAEIYRSRIEGFARRFDHTVVVTRRSADMPAPIGQPLYRLHFLVAQEGGTTNTYIQLTHVGDERVVRSTAVVIDRSSHPATEPFATPGDLAFVRDAVQLHGAIAQDLVNVPEISTELACLARAWNHDLAISPEKHREARDCLVAVVNANATLVPALTMLGALHLGDFRHNSDHPTDDPLGRADRLLRRAIHVAPSSSAPYQVLQNLMLLRGDGEAAVAAGLRSLQNNPEDMIALAGYGAVLARIGRYEEAVSLLTRAAAETAVEPQWMQFHTFLALNNLGRTREADERAAFFDRSTAALPLAAAAIRAHRRGDEAGAARAIAAVAKIEPEFRHDPKGFLRRRGFTEPVADRLLVDLVAAGLGRTPP